MEEDERAWSLKSAGYMLYSVSYCCDGTYEDGGTRAISFEETRAIFGKVPDLGGTLSHEGDDGVEYMYTRVV